VQLRNSSFKGILDCVPSFHTGHGDLAPLIIQCLWAISMSSRPVAGF